ncbi:MAG: ankyrin repeat domain-containing protein, partial [Verrucomicrobiota bacterium]
EGRQETAQALIAAGADVNGTLQPKKQFSRSPRAGTTPLLLAVENGHFELGIALIQAGADPNEQRSGFTALHALSWVRKPNRGDGEDGDPPPIGSGKMSSLEFARRIAELGANVNARMKSGRSGRAQLNRAGATPFMLASVTDDLPLMKLLVDLGADPLMPNLDEATPLMAAAGLGTMAPTEEAGTEEEAVEAVSYLIKLGADVNAVDKNGETAMHGAAYKNLPKIVDLLAANGAQVEIWNRTNRWGWTPLHIAAGYRVGNYKPSPDTLAALQRAMRTAGVTPPTEILPPGNSGPDYAPPAAATRRGQ